MKIRLRYNQNASGLPWILPMISVMVLVFVLSTRMLSDPDLGSHLKGGQWISGNHSVPQKEVFTYGAAGNTYIDMNWLFQLGVYQFWRITGYNGLSLLVTVLALTLFLLLMAGNRARHIPENIACVVLLPAFLVLEQRFNMRPEMITFLFLAGYMFILDRYYHDGRNRLYLLPVIMLFWVNIHGLFILGLMVTGVYWISLVARDRQLQLKFLSWLAITIAVCLVNPYFTKGFIFPFELITRFDPQNIFHQHIRELMSFGMIDRFVFRDVLFLVLAGVTVLSVLLTLRKRSVHEFILLALFLYLALVGVRNIGLFAVITVPILGSSLPDLMTILKKSAPSSFIVTRARVFNVILFIILILVPVILIPRIVTNRYYADNRSYYKTGTGIDAGHQPEKAAVFLNRYHLDGRMINSIAFGGWLSWRLEQPVFIDGRLEVMTEPLYEELAQSWEKGLDGLVDRYHPDLIAYNYIKYFPWTVWLAGHNEWRLVWLDGFAAVYARNDYAPKVPSVDIGMLPVNSGLSPVMTAQKKKEILNALPPNRFADWFQGFYRKTDENITTFQNIGSYCLQIKKDSVAERFLLESLRLSGNTNTSVYYALADIYRNRGQNDLAATCYTRILSFDPGNETAADALRSLSDASPFQPANSPSADAESKKYFNSGNQKYQYGDIKGAISDYTMAVELNPGYFKAYNNRGIAKALGLNQYKEALEDFDKAIGINPDYADAWLGRGTAKFKLNDRAGACSDWEKARNLGSRQAEDMIFQYCK